MVQLGYGVPAEDVARRLAALESRRQVFVAERGGEVVGWTGVCTDDEFVGGFGALVEGFVVDESARGLGVGAQLLEAVEAWAKGRGCEKIRVQSNVVRERAHAFYERNGYVKVKAQYQLKKTL